MDQDDRKDGEEAQLDESPQRPAPYNSLHIAGCFMVERGGDPQMAARDQRERQRPAPKCKAAAFGGQGLQPTQGVYQAAAQAAGALDQRE